MGKVQCPKLTVDGWWWAKIITQRQRRWHNRPNVPKYVLVVFQSIQHHRWRAVEIRWQHTIEIEWCMFSVYSTDDGWHTFYFSFFSTISARLRKCERPISRIVFERIIIIINQINVVTATASPVIRTSVEVNKSEWNHNNSYDSNDETCSFNFACQTLTRKSI